MKIHSICKEKAHHEYIEDVGVGFVMDTFTYGKAGYILEWELSIYNDETFNGNKIEEFLICLDELKNKFSLSKKSDHSTDTLIIYTDELELLYYFLYNYDINIKMFHGYYFRFKEVFEFRKLDEWYGPVEHNSKIIAKKAQALIDTIFKDDNKFYITRTQSVLNKIKKNCDSTIAKDIFPVSYIDYKMLLASYFGGICVANVLNYEITEQYDFPIMEIDRKSAYIFDLLIEKHSCEPLQIVDVRNADFFLNNLDKYFVELKIKINKIYNMKYYMSYLKDIKGEKISGPGEYFITGIDFNILKEACDLLEYEIQYIQVAKLDYLPSYLREVIQDEFIKKVELENSCEDKDIVNIQKKKVNSIYGATVKRIQEKDFAAIKDSAFLAPQWGIETTAYARKNLLNLALKLNNWLYTDTDSIYSENSESNFEILMNYNNSIMSKTEEYCNKFGLDFEIFKHLGVFMFKEDIVKMKILGKKQYMYTNRDGKFECVASGIPKGKYGEEAYELDKLKAGSANLLEWNPESTVCEIDGQIYESNGSGYYENYDSDSQEYMQRVFLNILLKRR